MKKDYKKYGVVAMVICLTVSSFLYIITHKEDEYEFTTSQVTDDSEVGMRVEEIDIGCDIDDMSDIKDMQEIPVEHIEIQKVPIYICGEVNKPDVYYLDSTTIIKEAIIAAGGFTEDADKEMWNLAMEIQKGEKIYIPKVGEQIDKTGNSYDNRVSESEPATTAREIININKANTQELMLLPGIGPTISQNIIDYRNANGEFKTLQDVTNVPRIGQGTLEKIKEYICFQ